ncbi:MAG: xanthine dehydrogenase family protein subunit M [Actinomycetia bacterium]|nr:xanthine dehydrogenase family protein subunit M [Actinomycetes bacterium]
MRYLAPTSVGEAITMLTEQGGRVFAGATDVIPQMRAGRDLGEVMVDLKKIGRLTNVEVRGDTWIIGAATPTSALTSNPDFVADFPGLAHGAGLIGSDQVQSRSSLGGNLCNASPGADSVPAMVVNQARAVVAGPGGGRTISVAEVPTGPGQTSLGDGEFVVEFEIDRPAAGTSDAYQRVTPRTEMDIAIVGAGSRISLDSDGVCTSATIALGAVAPTVVRVPGAEAVLVGAKLVGDDVDQAALDAAAAAASAACNPIDDMRGTIAYRTHVAGVLVERTVIEAARRASER